MTYIFTILIRNNLFSFGFSCEVELSQFGLYNMNDNSFKYPSYCPIGVNVLNIIKGGKLVYPCSDTFEDSMTQRAQFIIDLAKAQNITVVESRNIAYQHRFNFVRSDGATAIVTLWYGKKGYTNGPVLIRTTDETFGGQCLKLCSAMPNSGQYQYVPINHETSLLHKYILSITEEIGITIINVLQNEWAIMYYLKTEGEAIAKFCTNRSMEVKTLVPYSSLGNSDDKLLEFCERFKNYNPFFSDIIE